MGLLLSDEIANRGEMLFLGEWYCDTGLIVSYTLAILRTLLSPGTLLKRPTTIDTLSW